MTSRTFFKSLMGAVAAVALAPEIAFGVRLRMPEVPEIQGYVIPTHGWLVMRWQNNDSYHVCVENDKSLPWDEFKAKLQRRSDVTELLNHAGGVPVECSIQLYQ